MTSAAHADEALAPWRQAYEPQTVDERGMWMQADEAERIMRNSPLVIRDETLNTYVRGVLCRTVGEDRCAGVRVQVLELPAFNATMYPNGLMTVWSGLLLRVHSEAELGAVLGHEFGHFEKRHSLAAFQKARSAGDASAWLTVLGGFAGTNTALTQLSLVGSFYHFQRQQEEEADLIGIAYLGTSQYPSSAASRVWQNLMAEQDATYAGRKRNRKHRYNAGYFDSHPTELNRATYLAEAAGKIGDEADPGTSSYFAAMEHFTPRFLDAQIKLNDFGGTEFILNQLASANGWTPNLLYARGQMYQTRGNPRDLVSAAQYYRDAIAAGYVGADAHRNLGLALLKNGNATEGYGYLQTYLQLAPDAGDVALIRSLVPADLPSSAGAPARAPITSQPITEALAQSPELQPQEMPQ